MDYYQKYLKYKNKYLNLCNLIGGNEKTAKNHFVSQFLVPSDIPDIPNLSEYNSYISMNDDEFVKSNFGILNKEIRVIIKKIREINKKNFNFNRFKQFIKYDTDKKIIVTPDFNVDNYNNNNQEQLNRLFDIIYENLKRIFPNHSLLNEQIDFIIASYINNTFGISSSFENIGRFIEANNSYKKLINYQDRINPEIKQELINVYNQNSLISLEEYLRTSKIQDAMTIISNIEGESDKARLEQIELKKKGEMKPIFETENALVYNPQNEEQSRYYGSHTQWCTAAREKCMFKMYNDEGPLYIFISKKHKIQVKGQMVPVKYQLHIQTNSLMNMNDEPISMQNMLETFENEHILYNYLEELIFKHSKSIKINIINHDDNSIFFTKFNQSFPLKTIYKYNKYILDLEIDFKINKELTLMLQDFINLKKLTLTGSFNYPLNDSLLNLTNLEELELGDNFNQLLDNSLQNLTNLKRLKIGNNFMKPLNDSLNNLKKLETLILGDYFNKPLGNILDNLTNLKIILLHGYNHPLGNSLNNLEKLELLHLFKFNKPLDNSLDNLTNLKSLTLGYSFNHPLDNSLKNLKNLEELILGDAYNHSLNNSLESLINLKKLVFGNRFDEPLGNSLHNLKKLEYIQFGYSFNHPLDNSLEESTELKEIIFGYFFNKPLGNSLDKLTKLERISFGYNFNQPLDLEKLQRLPNINEIIKNYNLIYSKK